VEKNFDASRMKRDLSDLTILSQSFGMSLTRALTGAVMEGRKLSDVMRGLMLSLARQALSRSIGSLTNTLLRSTIEPALRQAPGVSSAPMQVTMNIAAADLESFRRSERQVAAGVVRALTRGKGIL
jgi:hypothetical protein